MEALSEDRLCQALGEESCRLILPVLSLSRDDVSVRPERSRKPP